MIRGLFDFSELHQGAGQLLNMTLTPERLDFQQS